MGSAKHAESQKVSCSVSEQGDCKAMWTLGGICLQVVRCADEDIGSKGQLRISLRRWRCKCQCFLPYNEQERVPWRHLERRTPHGEAVWSNVFECHHFTEACRLEEVLLVMLTLSKHHSQFSKIVNCWVYLFNQSHPTNIHERQSHSPREKRERHFLLHLICDFKSHVYHPKWYYDVFDRPAVIVQFNCCNAHLKTSCWYLCNINE